MSKATVKVDLKARPKGDLIEVPGLGLFTNGKTEPVTEEQIEMYENQMGYGARKFPSGGLVITDTPQETKTPYMEPQARAVDGGTIIDYQDKGAPELLAPEGEAEKPAVEGGK